VTSFLLGILQQTPSNAPQPGGGSPFMQFMPLILIFAVFYFLVIRPQSRKAKQHQQMLSALKKGDDVVTSGGVIGRVTGIKDEEITLQVQEGVRLRILRSAVTAVQRSSGEAAKAETKDAKGDTKA
jgi:preprotein translocase subunit YajC